MNPKTTKKRGELPKYVKRLLGADEHLSRYFHRMRAELTNNAMRQLRVLQVIHSIDGVDHVLCIEDVRRSPDGFVVRVR